MSLNLRPWNGGVSLVNPHFHKYIQAQMTEADERLLSIATRTARFLRKVKVLPVSYQPDYSDVLLQEGSISSQDMTIPGVWVAGTYTLFSLALPPGCEGAVTDETHWVEGAGFTQGSGQLTWQLKIGNGWAMDRGRMLIANGSSSSGPSNVTSQGAYKVLPNQIIKMQVVVSAAGAGLLDPAAVIIGRVKGWYKAR